MKMWKPLSTATAFAALFCASGAQADLTAAQVWQDWKDYYTSMGQTVTAAGENMQGDTLVVTDVKFSTKVTGGTSEGTIPELRLKEVGDGTVEITMSEEIPFVVHNVAPDGKATDAKMTIKQTGMTAKASGSLESMDYDYIAPKMALSIDEMSVDGKAPPFKMEAALSNIEGKYHLENGDARVITSDIKAAALDLAISGADPEGGGTFNLTGKMNGLTGTGGANMPKGINLENLGAALQAGMSVDGVFAFTDGAYKIDATGPEGALTADTTGAAGNIKFKMSKDGIAYGGDNGETKLTLNGAAIPFPVEASIAQTAFNFAMPVAKSDAASPASLLIKMVDLKVSDALWNMIDPGTQLPRDPATLVIDVSGAVRPLIDLFDPAQTAALSAADAPNRNPFELSEAKINALQVKAVGAELTGTGAFTFDNSTSTPKPNGAVDLKLTGANKLMDTLVAMHLIPEDQVMGFRMMLGMFAVPAGDDALTSKIEFKEDGGIYANGQKLQ